MHRLIKRANSCDTDLEIDVQLGCSIYVDTIIDHYTYREYSRLRALPINLRAFNNGTLVTLYIYVHF